MIDAKKLVSFITATNEEYITLENQSAHEKNPRNGAEWVELFVTEMKNATSVDDARCRAMRMLESLEKSITQNSGDHAQTLHKVSVCLCVFNLFLNCVDQLFDLRKTWL